LPMCPLMVPPASTDQVKVPVTLWAMMVEATSVPWIGERGEV
jgi:hypothetical protein